MDLLWEVHQWERWVLILVGGGEQVSEIARSLGMPIGTALSQLRRGRSHLAAMLKQRRRVFGYTALPSNANCPLFPLRGRKPSVPTSGETGSPWKSVVRGRRMDLTRAEAFPSPIRRSYPCPSGAGRCSSREWRRRRDHAEGGQEAEVLGGGEAAHRSRGGRMHPARRYRGAAAPRGHLQLPPDGVAQAARSPRQRGSRGRKPGRKPKQDAKDRRIAELEKRSARLEEKLALAEKLIDLQKKVSAILGINLTSDEER